MGADPGDGLRRLVGLTDAFLVGVNFDGVKNKMNGPCAPGGRLQGADLGYARFTNANAAGELQLEGAKATGASFDNSNSSR